MRSSQNLDDPQYFGSVDLDPQKYSEPPKPAKKMLFSKHKSQLFFAETLQSFDFVHAHFAVCGYLVFTTPLRRYQLV